MVLYVNFMLFSDRWCYSHRLLHAQEEKRTGGRDGVELKDQWKEYITYVR